VRPLIFGLDVLSDISNTRKIEEDMAKVGRGPLIAKQTGRLAKEKESLVKLGMTAAEIDAWYVLADAAGRMLRLPVLHSMEREEVCHDFHKLQNRLLARPGLRAVGWGG
jgi:hypothetical protein